METTSVPAKHGLRLDDDDRVQERRVQPMQPYQQQAIDVMVDAEVIRRKHDLLAAEMHHYFSDICPELVARWKEAMLGLPPSILRELAGRLQELEDFTDQTNLELRAAHDATAEDRGYAEELLDRALASLEHLGEVAEAMTRRLDELLKA